MDEKTFSDQEEKLVKEQYSLYDLCSTYDREASNAKTKKELDVAWGMRTGAIDELRGVETRLVELRTRQREETAIPLVDRGIDSISARQLRKILFHLSDEEMTIKELRRVLFNVEPQDAQISIDHSMQYAFGLPQ